MRQERSEPGVGPKFVTTHRPTRPEAITNPPGPKLVKNTDRSGAKSGDHTHTLVETELAARDASNVVNRLKSHTLIGLGVAAIHAGHKVRYFTAAELVETLYNIVGKIVESLLRVDLIIS